MTRTHKESLRRYIRRGDRNIPPVFAGLTPIPRHIEETAQSYWEDKIPRIILSNFERTQRRRITSWMIKQKPTMPMEDLSRI